MAGSMSIREYQLLLGEVYVTDIVAIDDKTFTDTDKIRPAMCELLGQQTFNLTELHRYYSRITVCEDK